MQRDTSAKSEPDLLFSPEPSEKPRSSMTGERDKNSVLFKLDDVVNQAKAIPQPVQDESSGLVEIKSLLADEQAVSAPAAAGGATKRDSSGLVDLNKLLADEEAAKKADAAVPVVPAVPPLTPTPVADAEPDVEVATAGPTIPTWMLVGVIVALAATVGVLALKLL